MTETKTGGPLCTMGKTGVDEFGVYRRLFDVARQNKAPAIALHTDRRRFQTVRKRTGQKTYGGGFKTLFSLCDRLRTT